MILLSILPSCVSCCGDELRVETVYGARVLVTGVRLLLFSLFFSQSVQWRTIYRKKKGSGVFVDTAVKCVTQSRS